MASALAGRKKPVAFIVVGTGTTKLSSDRDDQAGHAGIAAADLERAAHCFILRLLIEQEMKPPSGPSAMAFDERPAR